VADEDFERRLWEETDRSLRRDPERWVVASATELSFSTAGRSGDEDSARRSERALNMWERRRVHRDLDDDRWV
jgi:hypothetical protein